MRRSQKIKITVLLLALLFSVGSASAQKYRAAIKKIDSPGFYRISLQPEFVAKSEADLFDVRLQNAKGQEIPYVNSADVPVKSGQRFLRFPVIEKAAQTDSETSLVVENKAQQPLRRIWITLKNTNASFTISIAGSDNRHDWFAVTDAMSPEQPTTGDNGESQIDFDFPASNYHYFKILAKERHKTPINLLAAGIYTSPSLVNTYRQISLVKVSQRDSEKTSYVSILLNDNYQVNKIHLDIGGPRYFRRPVSVYADTGKQPVLISQNELNSSAPADFYLSAKTRRILLEIGNADNLPLIVKEAQAFQADEYIISYLEKGQYYLLTGSPASEAPSYDLKFFSDSLHYFIPEISHGPVIKNPSYHDQPKTAKHDYTYLIWVAIIAALLLLSLLTWKMVTEVNNKTGKT